jgi:glycosyltransferase involved in cell wall biosynthesis
MKLVGLLRRLHPDLMMTWLYHADLVGTLAGRVAGVGRIIWNIRCSDMEFSRYPATTRWVVAALVRLSGLPWAIGVNSRAGQRAHDRLGYRPRQWAYLPNGFDTEVWRPNAQERGEVRKELGFVDSDTVVGMVARVDPQKDHATFLEAARVVLARHPRFRVLLVGRDTDGLELPDELRSITKVLGERRDVKRLMQALDILVSSSAYGEGFPNVIGEAMACGVPCVATDVGDSANILGDTGQIVEPLEPHKLASAIAGLVEMPSVDLRKCGVRARERVKRYFSVDTCLARYGELVIAAVDRRSDGVLDRSWLG